MKVPMASMFLMALLCLHIIVHLTRPVIAMGDLSSRDALQEVIGVVAVGTIPAYRTLSQLCTGSRLDDPAPSRTAPLRWPWSEVTQTSPSGWTRTSRSACPVPTND